MNRLATWLIAALSPVCFAAGVPDSHLLVQKPTLSQTLIVFACSGDLWSVPREGGDAHRLTVGAGVEDNPFFSPDGSSIAFTREYDGNTDVFVMPATGGVPKWLTWHPADDVARGWTPDGKRIPFSSYRTAYARWSIKELFTVYLDGRFPQKILRTTVAEPDADRTPLPAPAADQSLPGPSIDRSRSRQFVLKAS